MRNEGGRLHLLTEECRIAVLDAQPALGIDHFALALDHLRIEGQARQPIALEIEHQLERRARERVLVDGDILRGVGVVAAAVALEQPIEFALRAVRGAVEHHVLEEVRQAGRAGALVAAAHVHPVEERDARDPVVRPHDHLQAVGERVRLNRRAGVGEAHGRHGGDRRRAASARSPAKRRQVPRRRLICVGARRERFIRYVHAGTIN